MHPDHQLLIANARIREHHDEAASDRLAHKLRVERLSQAARNGPLRPSRPRNLGGSARAFVGRIRRPAFLRPART